MNYLKEYAIRAFKEGSDNYGETVTGETTDLMFTKYGEKDKGHYHITVFLTEKHNGEIHPCTSGIGFYPNREGTKLGVCSGHMMPWTIDITPEIKQQMDEAISD